MACGSDLCLGVFYNRNSRLERAAQMLAEFYKAKTLDLNIGYTAGGISMWTLAVPSVSQKSAKSWSERRIEPSYAAWGAAIFFSCWLALDFCFWQIVL